MSSSVLEVAIAGNANHLIRVRNRQKAGLANDPLVIAVANQDRGVPYAAILVGALLIFWTYVLNRTRFGRHAYAVGGNAEAARRAGINVDRVKIACFMIVSVMAVLGGILASRLRSVLVRGRPAVVADLPFRHPPSRRKTRRPWPPHPSRQRQARRTRPPVAALHPPDRGGGRLGVPARPRKAGDDCRLSCRVAEAVGQLRGAPRAWSARGA